MEYGEERGSDGLQEEIDLLMLELQVRIYPPRACSSP
jgi:hypothetical protein